jgi:uncharacterized protein (TIGR03083 family)
MSESPAVEITPRYGGPPIIQLGGDPAAIATPVARQRRRLESMLGALTDEQWRAPSRCEGWSAQDVVTHLVTVNRFWAFSIGAGLGGRPSEILRDFDPVASPAQMVAAEQGTPPAQTLANFADSNAALLAALDALDDAGWSTLAEAPPGHISISALAHHALWDCWVHERDILQPLGVAQEEHDDEVVASLRYAAALGAGFTVMKGEMRDGTLAIDAKRPDVTIVVTVGDDVVRVRDDVHDDAAVPATALVLSGDAVELLEMLSIRAPFTHEVPADRQWLVAGLAEVFEAG